MIEFTRGFKVGDKVFATIEEAQAAELHGILKLNGAEGIGLENDVTRVTVGKVVEVIVVNADAVINILSTTSASRPAARKANGAKRKPRKSTTPEPTPA